MPIPPTMQQAPHTRGRRSHELNLRRAYSQVVPAADRTINVFLASPSDVDDERELVLDVIQRVNEAVARPLGWYIRAWGWELRRPGLGRAQDLINPEVDTCDVLIGILHAEFGTPTGDYESGFEEEFERVRHRRDAGEHVDAFIYLRELGDVAADPRNLAFRERLKQVALYDTYASLGVLRAKATEHLSGLVAEFVSESSRHAQQEGRGTAAPPSPEPIAELEAGATPAEGATSLRAVAAALSGEHDDSDESGLNRLTLLRAHLATSAELSTRVTSSLMHVHDLMRLYEERDDISLSERERYFIARSMVGLGSLGAGWGLLPRATEEEIGTLAAVDGAEEVRTGALTHLGSVGLDAFARGIAETTNQPAAVVLASLWEIQEDGGPRRALVRALTRSTIEDVDLLLACIAAEEGDTQASAFEALGNRLLTSDPSAALDLLIDKPSWMPDDAEERLAARVHELGKERLTELYVGSRQTRRIAMRLLERAGWLDDSEVHLALRDDDDEVRRGALRAALSRGLPLELGEAIEALRRDDQWAGDDEATELRVEFLKRGDPDWLLGSARWDKLDFLGVNAIRAAMAQGYPQAFQRAERDLGDPEIARAEARDAIAASVEDDAERRAKLEETDRYARTFDIVYVSGLLEGLAEFGTRASDADLARPYLQDSHPTVAEAAAEVLLRVGAAQDLDALVAYASSSYGARRRRVLQRILELRPDGAWLLSAVEQVEGSESFVGHALDAIAAHGLSLSDQRLDELLRFSNDGVRRNALRIVIAGKNVDQLRALMDGYVQAPRYRYYDVIASLDRLIYAPDSVQAETKHQLDAASG
jgi:hypothetical protein